MKRDLVVLVEFRRMQGNPLFGRGAGEIVLGQVRPVAGRRLIGAQDCDRSCIPFPAPPPPIMTTEAGRSGRASRAGTGLAICSRAKTRPPLSSTRQQGTGESAGGRSAAPVRRLKQA